jgi:hypothetical protein
MQKDCDDQNLRKEYFPPRIVHTEKIETRAAVCARGNDATCGAGPIQS